MRNLLKSVFIFLILQQSAIGQDLSEKSIGLQVNFSYYGEIMFHPGAKVSMEFPLWSKIKLKESGKRSRTKQRDILLIPGAGFYVHPNSHTAVFINLETGYRKISKKTGFKMEALLGIGYQGRINAGTTYEVADDGTIKERRVAGRSYFTTSLGFGLGQDLFVKKQIPIAWHIRPYAVFWIPYNTTAMPSFDLEMGITYRFMKKK